MKRTQILGIFIILLCFLIQANVFAGTKYIKKGDKFPDFKLPVPKDASELKYLGLKGEGTFEVQDIKAKVVLIQVFHSG